MSSEWNDLFVQRLRVLLKTLRSSAVDAIHGEFDPPDGEGFNMNSYRAAVSGTHEMIANELESILNMAGDVRADLEAPYLDDEEDGEEP